MGGGGREGHREHVCAMGYEGVACDVQEKDSSEGHPKGRNNKMDGEKKKTIFPAKMSGEKKIEKIASKVPARIDPRPQPRRP